MAHLFRYLFDYRHEWTLKREMNRGKIQKRRGERILFCFPLFSGVTFNCFKQFDLSILSFLCSYVHTTSVYFCVHDTNYPGTYFRVSLLELWEHLFIFVYLDINYSGTHFRVPLLDFFIHMLTYLLHYQDALYTPTYAELAYEVKNETRIKLKSVVFSESIHVIFIVG